MRALVDVSEEQARAVCARDDELDHLYRSVYEDSMKLMEAAPDKVRQATHMLFIAHHLERLGDRVTNIGEDVVFLVEGKSIKHHAEDRGEARATGSFPAASIK